MSNNIYEKIKKTVFFEIAMKCYSISTIGYMGMYQP